MSIFITGDTHGDVKRFSMESFPEQKEMTKDDFVVILGDFGLIWEKEETKDEKYWLDWLEKKSFTTLFIDGNHENHARLSAFPVSEWHGGKVHKIRPSVIHLMRGEVYDIDGARCFAFGGAPSHDITGLATEEELKKNYAAGILNRDDPDFKKKVKEMEKRSRDGESMAYRVRNESWWDGEIASEEEFENAKANLEKVHNKVTFVFSHDAPSSTVAIMYMGAFPPNIQSRYLEELRWNLDYKVWFFGHYHENRRVTEREICLYEQITQIW